MPDAEPLPQPLYIFTEKFRKSTIMKTTRIVWAVFALFLANAEAGFRLPPTVYEVSEIETAIEKSKARNVPITFLVSDKDTTCGLCVRASEQIIDEMRISTVVVYLRSQNELPAGAKSAIQGVDRGQYIPYAFVFNNDLDKLIGVLRYEEIKADSRQAFREIKKSIRESKKPS